MRTVRKMRYITGAPAVFAAARDRASEEAEKRARAHTRRTAHRIAGDLLGTCARDLNQGSPGGGQVVEALREWMDVHTCLGDLSVPITPKRATQILQAIDPLVAELSALAKRAISAGGQL